MGESLFTIKLYEDAYLEKSYVLLIEVLDLEYPYMITTSIESQI